MPKNRNCKRVGHAHAPGVRNLIALTALSIVSSVVACATHAPTTLSPTPGAVVRVIVRFGPLVSDPQRPAFLVRLAAQAHVSGIEAIRSMSGDAFVMRVTCTDPRDPRASDPCPAALARLLSSEGVVALEVDRRERIL